MPVHIFTVMIPSCRWSNWGLEQLRDFTQVSGRQGYDQRCVWPGSSHEHFGDWNFFLQKVAHPLRTAEVPIKNRPSGNYLKSVASLAQFHFSFSFHLQLLALQTELWGHWWVQLVEGLFVSTKHTLSNSGFASIHRRELARTLSDTPRHHAYGDLYNY